MRRGADNKGGEIGEKRRRDKEVTNITEEKM